MNNYFECKVSYDKLLENGLQKKVTEPYLVDALSFSEAEERIIKELRPLFSGEFSVAAIRRCMVSEIFFNKSGDRYFRFKINFITLDEKSGVEKKTAAYMLAQASTIDEAKDILKKGIKDTIFSSLCDYEVERIEETKLMDVFVY